MGSFGRVALRRDDQEAGAASLRALADLVEQRTPEDRLVGDHEDVLLAGLGGDVDNDVLDRAVTGDVADPVDHVLAQPTRLLLRMGRDHDRVDWRLQLGERVADGGHRIGLDDEAMSRDSLVAEHPDRPVEPAARRGASRVLVHDVAALRLVHGRDDGDAEIVAAVALHRLDQLAAGNRLVGDDQQVHQWTRTSSAARSPLSTAWRAPGTPYSYGLPTTCGISSKLKIGGGEVTCHSSVSARHGLPGAGSPRRMLMIML